MSGKSKKFTPYDLFQKDQPSKKTIQKALFTPSNQKSVLQPSPLQTDSPDLSTEIKPSIKKAVFPSFDQKDENKKTAPQEESFFIDHFPFDRKPNASILAEKKRNPNQRPLKIHQNPTSRLLQQESIDSFFKIKEKGNGYRKVAKFLLLLGMDQASTILRELSPDEVEKITAEIAKIHTITKEEANEIMNLYEDSKKQLSLPRGGSEVAKEFLIKTYGEKEGLEKFNKTVPIDANREAFDFLKEAEGWQIYEILKEESPLVIASIIPFLSPAQSSNLLRELPTPYKIEITKRVAKMQHLDREAILNLEFALREKIRRLGKTKDHLTNGSTTLANILKYMDQESEESILESLETESITLSKEVREKLFTIDMIVNVLNTDLQRVLTDYSDQELAIILKGKSPEIIEKILSNVSKNRAEIIVQEKELLGAMKKSEVDEVTRKLLLHLRKLQLFGEITVKMEGEEWLE